ncbi:MULTISPECIES: YkoF family thiamine/hydroxymethylpyrimidine-binding protein [unclassified Actinotalea]|uniref:YkoF family thiamine/hydroxymethylpyrimidine-binding protein n=1 Tax=unclassified Actinotalea TaxID=2638618 RepID=UPI0015F42E60|nr:MULTISPECIES: YkoF family thiamine/hydroxymethylpyrimidine-binding protein [unclassified Actinotalea]
MPTTRTTAPTSTAPTSTAPTTTAPTTSGDVPDHVRAGVGLRLTLLPAADDVVPPILGALAAAALEVPGLEVATDDVSTLVRGPEQDLARYLVAVLTSAVAATPSGHVVAVVHLSRGCPGELDRVAGETGCAVAGDLPGVAPVSLPATGLRAAAHWALYPLGVPDAMGPIERAIARAGDAGTLARPEHFVTRLEGDLADVLATVVDTWAAVGGEVRHVVSHATVSLGSPSAATAAGR